MEIFEIFSFFFIIQQNSAIFQEFSDGGFGCSVFCLHIANKGTRAAYPDEASLDLGVFEKYPPPVMRRRRECMCLLDKELDANESEFKV